MGKRTAYHAQYWRDNREKRRAQKRESNARVRARKRAALPPKLFDHCLRCKRRLRDKAARQLGYGRICAILMLGQQTVPQLDWIGYSRSDRARLTALAGNPKAHLGRAAMKERPRCCMSAQRLFE